MKIQIKHRYTSAILFEHASDDNTMANTLRAAIGWGADLRGANLRWDDLHGANLHGANLSGAVIDGIAIPSVDEAAPLLRQVAQSALAAPDALDMRVWHTCETTHCIAGWAVALSGDKGRELEDRYGCADAGLLLLGAEAATHFYDGNKTARKWLQGVLDGGK